VIAGWARCGGLTLRGSNADHWGMESPHVPRELPPIAPAAAAQLEAMLELQEEMRKLHAQVEYVALMLKLGLRPV